MTGRLAEMELIAEEMMALNEDMRAVFDEGRPDDA
jgi:hypothetical protein